MIALLLAQALYTDHGNPTADEQRVLELINRARANPTDEGNRLAIPGGITEGLLDGTWVADVGPRPPLAMNALLLGVARAHSLDMYTRGFLAHVNPSGLTPGQRVTASGYIWFGVAENIAASTAATAEELEDLLMIDDDVDERGHRTNLLDIDPGSSTYMREIGIGYYSAPSTKEIPLGSGKFFGDFLTQNFGRTDTPPPFLLGVAYYDANANDFYDEGEGIGRVSVTVSGGAFYALTAAAGGYAFPTASSGAVNVTGSGTSLPADVVVAITLTSANRKIDFRVPPQTDTDGDDLPDFWETRFGPLARNVDTDGDTYTNYQEFMGGSDPTSNASTPAPPPPPPPPPPGGGGSSSDSGGGGCGLTGLEPLLAGLLLRRRRRV